MSMDFDRRLYLFMREAIKFYQLRALSLGDLVNRLQELLAFLEFATEEWRQQFLTEWWELELPHAVALDRQHDVNSPEYANDIQEHAKNVQVAVNNLEAMVEKAIAEHCAEEQD